LFTWPFSTILRLCHRGCKLNRWDGNGETRASMMIMMFLVMHHVDP
jgi:hypothetical protein